MRTAVAQLIEKVESDTVENYSYEEVLELLMDCEALQNAHIKLAYIQGNLAALKKSQVSIDEYLKKEWEL